MAENEQTDPIVSALKDMLQSEGWRIYREACDHEWGPSGYGRRLQEGISTVQVGPDRPYELARIVEQVDATAKAVNAVLKWPAEEVARRAAPKPSTRPFDALRRMTR